MSIQEKEEFIASSPEGAPIRFEIKSFGAVTFERDGALQFFREQLTQWQRDVIVTRVPYRKGETPQGQTAPQLPAVRVVIKRSDGSTETKVHQEAIFGPTDTDELLVSRANGPVIARYAGGSWESAEQL